MNPWYPKVCPWSEKVGYNVEPEALKLVGLLSKQSSNKVLDIGCGHGRHVIYFAKKGCEVYGLDNYPTVIRKLRKELVKLGLSANLTVRDFRDRLPYPAHFFDMIIATRSIEHARADEIRKIFREIDTVIKPGGIIFLQIPNIDSLKYYEKIRIKNGKPQKYRLIGRCTYVARSGSEKGIRHHAFSKAELMHLLNNYSILEMHTKRKHNPGYCVIAKRRS